jgi:L-fuconolactonase
MRIDSHQHFWQYNPAQHVWMTDKMAVLRRDFLPADLSPLMNDAGFDATVAVQARQILEETDWLLDLADHNPFIRGVVGWVDLRAADVRGQLQRYVGRRQFKGVRHIVEDEPDVNFLLLPEFRRGIAALAEFGLTYDLLLRPPHIPAALKLVQEFPRQLFVVDHIAKPLIKDQKISPWREGIEALARCDNVYCKLSGMVTEASWRAWRSDDFTPYLDIVFQAFGTDRVMIGSDWPVCILSGEYRPVMQIVLDYVRRFAPGAEEKIAGGNCAAFYRI